MKKYILITLSGLLSAVLTQAQVLYNNGTTLQVNTGCIVQVNGNVQIQSGSTFTNNGSLTITGNLINNSTMSAANTGHLLLNGSSAQTIDGSGTYFAKNVTLNNSAGVTLNAPLKVDGTFTFTNGVLNAGSTTNSVTFTTNATHTGASNASHVNGYVVKEGTGSFSYPVGDATTYQKVDVNPTANATGIQVKYNTTDAGSGTFATTGTDATALVTYNALEHWDITPLTTATGSVTIYWDAYNNTGIANVSDLKVAHKTGGNWLNEGTTGSGTIASGSVTSNSISTWSPFTLGSISTLSTLPLQWLSINGHLNAQKQAIIGFKVNETNVANYEIEKSSNGISFNSIATVSSKGNGENYYQFTDAVIVDGTIYYRIKQVDIDGRFSYSAIIRLSNNQISTLTVYPNPAKDIVTISGTKAGTKAQLTSMSGKVLQQINITSVLFTIDMSQYSSGIYLLKTEGATQKIIKE